MVGTRHNTRIGENQQKQNKKQKIGEMGDKHTVVMMIHDLHLD